MHHPLQPAAMTAGQVNKALDRLDAKRSVLCDRFIEAGRGYELPSETERLADPLALEHKQMAAAYSALQLEIHARYGPCAPSRLPAGRGFGPRLKAA